MKKYFSFLAFSMLFMSVLFTSCDNNTEDNGPEPIVYKTPIKDVDFTVTVNGNEVLVVTNLTYEDIDLLYYPCGYNPAATNYHIVPIEEGRASILLPKAGQHDLIFRITEDYTEHYPSEVFSVTIDADFTPVLDTDFSVSVNGNYVSFQVC